MSESMTKQQMFLWMVQTIILSNGLNLSRDPATADEYRHEFSATGVFGTCQEAVRASEMIPPTLSAADAAHEFCFYMLSNLRKADDAASDRRAQVPAWFARS